MGAVAGAAPGAGPVRIDVVVPSIRVDTEEVLEALSLGAPPPPGVEVSYYVVSDNPSMSTRTTLHGGRPVRCTANPRPLGAPLSRNVGIEQGSGEFILFIDDDVSPAPGLLAAYAEAAAAHPDAPGYAGPTLFPGPVNAFTRGVRASGMLTFFDLPGRDGQMPWCATSNLMVRRSAVGGVRFSSAFPRHGGGEDIDFCLRVVERSGGRWLRTVPAAAVRHGWWGGGRRSYRRFMRWAWGDSRLVAMHPGWRYYSYPNLPETLLFGGPAAAALACAGLLDAWAPAAWLACCAAAEVAVERARVARDRPGRGHGIRDAAEAAAIRLSSDLARLGGMLRRGSARSLFVRFDFAGRMRWAGLERAASLPKFAVQAGSLAALSAASLLGWP